MAVSSWDSHRFGPVITTEHKALVNIEDVSSRYSVNQVFDSNCDIHIHSSAIPVKRTPLHVKSTHVHNALAPLF